MLKYSRLMIVLAVAAISASCTDEPVEPKFNIDSHIVNLSDGEEGFVDILLSSNSDLTAVVDGEAAGWLAAVVSRRCLTLSYPRNESGAERTGYIIVSAGELQQTVKLVQPEYIPPKEGYDVGDVVDDGKGMIYWVSPDDRNTAKAISVSRLKGNVWSTDASPSGARWFVNGSENALVLEDEKYQAALWCSSLGDGWYLPARDELIEIFEIYNGTPASDATVAHPGAITDAEKSARASFDSMLAEASADAMNTGGDDSNGDSYWSSTESETDASMAYYLRFGKYLSEPISKTSASRYTRCVKVYGDYTYGPEPELPDIGPEQGGDNPGDDGELAVGSVYREGGAAVGVVFWMSEDGSSAKIVSLGRTSSTVAWSTVGTSFLGADSKTDGAVNTAVLKESAEAASMPVLEYCAGLGEGWYWPASDELKAIYDAKSAVDAALASTGDALGVDQYWSSTEFGPEYPTYAAHFKMENGYIGAPADQVKKTGSTKRYGRCIRKITITINNTNNDENN